MSDEKEKGQIKYFDKDLIKALESTKEYISWQDSLFAIIGYISNEKLNDEDLINELMADHLHSSFELHNGLEKAKYHKSKKLREDWELDHSI